ncbi:phenylalanine--tRNA ligase subunit beta [Haloferax mediterranei ATCC 33500]|uniref:Phenylalanine--tRNA ligase beta subunit n=1 Tax=Haloferax mediterranei (strain ATCC 33500 / DSM 1411 / JCM 8866 / NBRC 14739 / NCIMB 2177 / R-4) TaxID=523841 RepID=I3R8P4_HALMT|nr:phenylalanine--tRNA ligase subunit beta [Haloferax mediterranei]AFK20604.1 phenylalanyl-tRNA synthetase subunit beta [Haloferax mediterranei ATCC 33500]EMA03078.1 phenylalanyl-tRNA ligase subunit beta [Haloferax mediterranei ATCC 33500]MDX5987742.1 phenylalanine--tRNA ligase subunit beta [Haloferax mediterranei ATCC 33500]QCQ74222.1 phenylalanine--tRNA ligase subunit beta [Haloferax mediterranei ATCC 33500]
MPVVDVQPDELRRLTGHEEKSDEEFKDDLFALGLEFEGVTEDGAFQLEFGPDRLDRLSVEGVARSLRYQYGDASGVAVPKTNDPDWTIVVDEAVPEERPYVTGAVVRGVDLDDAALDSLIQLQEKLHATMGRKRAKGAIGIHDLTMLKGDVLSENASGNSITYTGIEPDGDTFVALDSDDELTPAEVLEQHETGRKYADLVGEYDRYPAIYDEIGLFSFPPVINGRRTEVSTESRDLFVELTGTDQWTIDRMCNIICYALAARGATIEDIEVQYEGGTVAKPDFEVETKRVSHDRIETVLGVDLEMDEVIDLFERSGLDADAEIGEETVYDVSIPPYRVDVLHPLDLVDDVGRAYGFNELEPRYPDVGTVGQRHERSRLEDAARTSLVGLGFEDLLNFHMISEGENYERMGIEPGTDLLGGGEPVSITEPYSEDYTMLRSWVLPSLSMVLENNTHRAYPQDLAEIGHVAHRDDDENTRVSEARHVAAVLARHDATYEDAKGRLAALCGDFDVELETPPTEHPSFISGRTAAVVIDGEEVGIVGELHPEVIVEHDLELPVAAFEFDLSALQ